MRVQALLHGVAVFVATASALVSQNVCAGEIAAITMIDRRVPNVLHTCRFYLTTSRESSFLPGLPAANLTRACKCKLQQNGISIPAANSVSPSQHLPALSTFTCTKSAEQSLIAHIAYPKAFCNWFIEVDQLVMIVPGMSVSQFMQGCKCIVEPQKPTSKTLMTSTSKAKPTTITTRTTTKKITTATTTTTTSTTTTTTTTTTAPPPPLSCPPAPSEVVDAPAYGTTYAFTLTSTQSYAHNVYSTFSSTSWTATGQDLTDIVRSCLTFAEGPNNEFSVYSGNTQGGSGAGEYWYCQAWDDYRSATGPVSVDDAGIYCAYLYENSYPQGLM